MPKQLMDCKDKLIHQGKSESDAYAICSKSTGWIRSKGGWKNKKTGETFNENRYSRGSFKSFLNEYTEREIHELIASRAIPLDEGMMKRLGYYQEDQEVYHVTNSRDLWGMADKQNKRKNHLSCFTKGGPELVRLPSQPNVLLRLIGDTIIEGETDIWTLTSWRGKRWLDIRGRKGAEKLELYVSGVLQKVFDYWDFGIDVYRAKPAEMSEAIYTLSKSESKEFYKMYLREMENMLNKSYKELNKYIRSAAGMSYNEVILTKWKILEVWCIEHEVGAVKKWCEDKNISYGGAFPRKDLSKLKV
jgi:hypothetical protein